MADLYNLELNEPQKRNIPLSPSLTLCLVIFFSIISRWVRGPCWCIAIYVRGSWTSRGPSLIGGLQYEPHSSESLQWNRLSPGCHGWCRGKRSCSSQQGRLNLLGREGLSLPRGLQREPLARDRLWTCSPHSGLGSYFPSICWWRDLHTTQGIFKTTNCSWNLLRLKASLRRVIFANGKNWSSSKIAGY